MISNLESELAQRTASFRAASRDSILTKGRVGGFSGGYQNPVVTSGTGMLGMAELGMGIDSTSARHAEQYRYFKDYQFTAIRVIANRFAGQSVFVGRAPKAAGGKGGIVEKVLMEASREIKAAIVSAHDARETDYRQRQIVRSLPDCFKSFGEDIAPFKTHPLLTLLQTPNDIMHGWQFNYSSACNLQLTGECLWWVDDFDIQFGNGGTYKIWPLPSHWCVPEHRPPDPDQNIPGQLFYRWKIRSPRMSDYIYIPGEQMVYFYYPDPSDPLAAYSPMQAQAKAVATDEQIQSSQYYSMRDGLRPEVILKAGRLPGMDGMMGNGERPVLTADQRSQLIEAIKLAHRGVQRRGEPAIVDGLIDDIVPYSRSPHEMDFIKSSQLQKERIFLGFGVNPISAGQVEGANRASSAVADEHLVSNVLGPLCTLISQVMTAKLGPLFADDNETLVVWVDPPRPRDAEMRLKEWTLCASDTSPNERRKYVLNLPERSEPEADIPGFIRPLPIAKVMQVPGSEGSDTDGDAQAGAAADANAGRGRDSDSAGGDSGEVDGTEGGGSGTGKRGSGKRGGKTLALPAGHDGRGMQFVSQLQASVNQVAPLSPAHSV